MITETYNILFETCTRQIYEPLKTRYYLWTGSNVSSRNQGLCLKFRGKKKSSYLFVINCPVLTREKYDLIIYKIYFYTLFAVKCITMYIFIARINLF